MYYGKHPREKYSGPIVKVDRPESNIRVSVETDDGWVKLTHEATIHKTSELLAPARGAPKTKYARYVWDYAPAERLANWLEDRPHSISHQGELLKIQLTKNDAAIFKLFFT